MVRIVHVGHHFAFEDAVVALEADGPHVHVVLAADDAGDLVHDAYRVHAFEPDAGQEFHAVLALPTCHDAQSP